MKSFLKVMLIVVCVITIFGFKNTSAKEVVYTNEKGFEFDQEEYDFFTKIYGRKYVKKYFDQSIYNIYSDVDIDASKVKTKKVYTTSNERPTRDDTYYATPAKSIQIAKICGFMCRITLTAEWFAEPSVKSYDDIGVYLNGPTRTSTPITVATSDLTSTIADTTVYDTNGFGAVVKIPQGDDVIITQTFNYTGTGTVNGSYQHAMSTSSLTIAQMFNIDSLGFGGVFDFYGDAYDIYDDMEGVDIDV